MIRKKTGKNPFFLKISEFIRTKNVSYEQSKSKYSFYLICNNSVTKNCIGTFLKSNFVGKALSFYDRVNFLKFFFWTRYRFTK